ncbi:MAG: 50S ribosomal protein L9 [Candidatus Krumholzibacteriota bacterium]|nr:50S ribosomal protein L9 [Candidatus Krumholzibacteriota bacterium]
MEIILRETIDGLGERGDLVRVKDGYARNYLLPKKLAVPATAASRKVIEEESRLRTKRDEQLRRSVESLAGKMKDLSCTIVVQAGEEDKLYGSVTAHNIAEAIALQGFEVDHRMVVLEEPIKTLGVYSVPVRLHREVEVPVKIWVVKE